MEVDIKEVDVTAIRRTRGGDLLLQMKRGTKQTDDLVGAITKVIGEKNKIKKLVPSVTFEIRDIDAATDQDEIVEALTAVTSLDSKDVQIISLKPAFGGNQLAIIKLPWEASSDLIKVGKVRIGWVNCRLRPRVLLARCFRCRGFGHIAADCKSQHDRSKDCNKCGQEGHKAAACQNEPHCRQCADGGKSHKHQLGSRNCEVLRSELEKRSQQKKKNDP